MVDKLREEEFTTVCTVLFPENRVSAAEQTFT